MQPKNLAIQVQVDAFSRDLAIDLRRIFERDVDVESAQLPQPANPILTYLPLAENVLQEKEDEIQFNPG